MFRTIISPIFRSTRLCVKSLCYNAPTMLPAGGRQHRGCFIPQAFNTQSSAPEDGRNHRPKHFELIGIINKPLILHLVGCLYYLCPIIYFRNFVTSVFLMFGCSKIHPVQFDWSVSSVLLLLKLVSYESK